MSAAKKKTSKKKGIDGPPITWEQARAFRLARMHLADPLGPRSVRKVVRDLGGIQAQVASAGELQCAVRAQGLAPGAIERAIYKQRTLVKSWMMRGTLHWVDAADYPVWAAASRTRAPWNKKYWQKYFGVTGKQVEDAVDAIATALDRQCLTREQVADEVHARVKNKAIDELMRSGWGSVLKIAASQGTLCFGPNEGRNVAFVRPDQWLKGFKHLDTEKSIAEVLRRYLVAHGPATREEFARWWGFQPADARRVIESIENELTLVDRDGD
ncbi:MAG TPA: crosslink repair DNA glycosylase YcaQ family protein, partial [Actinomycetota bacterium]|nr:crosslink repair DNA glycosylase YcaQ family protein [Actinomycetota bacterium]